MARKVIFAVCAVLIAVTPLWAATRGVVAELFTSTTCGYCPYANYALNRIYDEQGPDKWVPVAWHVGGSYYTAEASTRSAYYGGGSGIPKMWADGLLLHYGAYTSNEQMYQWYMSSFSARTGMNAPVAITFLQKQYADGKVMVKIKLDLEENLTAGHVCHIILWEDQPGGQYRFVERTYTTKNLTITTQGQSEEFDHEFTISGWDETKLGLSIIVQDPTGKEVKNGRATTLESAYAVEPASVGRVKALYR